MATLKQLLATKSIILAYNKVCPFAHRGYLTLLEKQINFATYEVNLEQKNPQYTEVYHKAYASDPSSSGKIPVLIHGNNILAQSDLVAWYVAETFQSGNNLVPQDTFLRAKMRKFVQEIPNKLISAFYSTMGLAKKSEAQKAQVIQKLNKSLSDINQAIAGPFVLGDRFSLADIFIYPFFERWCVIEKFHGLKIDKSNSKIHHFISAMQIRPSVQQSRKNTPNEYYISSYEGYMK